MNPAIEPVFQEYYNICRMTAMAAEVHREACNNTPFQHENPQAHQNAMTTAQSSLRACIRLSAIRSDARGELVFVNGAHIDPSSAKAIRIAEIEVLAVIFDLPQ